MSNFVNDIYNQIEELKLNINKKEDDLKNLINEKDNMIKKLNDKILNQETKIRNNENEIKKLNNKIEELIKQNIKELKEEDNKINIINNMILNEEKEVEKIKFNFIEKINNIEKDLILKCYTNKSFKDKIYHELCKVEELEKKYGFLSSIGIKLLLPEHNYEIEGFIKAPDNSPYKNGIFNFLIKYPVNYPIESPQLIIKTKIFHCNVGCNGQNWIDSFT